jgi:hypothetical protein
MERETRERQDGARPQAQVEVWFESDSPRIAAALHSSESDEKTERNAVLRSEIFQGHAASVAESRGRVKSP